MSDHEQNEPKKARGRPPKKQPLQPATTATQDETPQAAQRGLKRKQPFADAERGPSTKSSNLISRSQTPMMDEGAITTRSGRTVYKPLAAWRGEKAVFAPRETIDLPLGALQTIVRTEEAPPPSPRPKARRAGRGRSASVGAGAPSGVSVVAKGMKEEGPLAEWEAEDGIQHAKVMTWDAQAEKYDEEHTEEVEIAFGANALRFRGFQSTLQLAKTFECQFFGSGIIDIPPGGEKRVKNAKKMQIVFYVFYGRVTVNIGTPTTTFSIGEGGQWFVPRGNFYSIINESEVRDTRLFFAQGCQWNGEDSKGNSTSAAE